MARFVDLEESDEDSSCSPAQAYTRKVIAAARTPSQPAQTENHESRPEVSDNDHASRASFAAALTCYPVSWVEIDCSDGSLVDHSDNEIIPGSRVGTPTGDRHDSPSPPSNKPGYLQQEIEGIGGVVKKKVKKRVKVGATVWEYDDERTSGKYLEREISGRERSWCGWCDRVCLGEHDRQVPA
ncbi:uncharacterized protein HMPREF1541_07746 [Cyphellophora europaea CBS 101466]|uniref:Uncharacterized protein n=1 Tax=Cyphellophora europaea (strain CBS 101466) TaxID=1220924 RepID=W2RNS5_CYPE1|nr:uncharacterized protein HMPREF1541_07746 [Cyphellophora europaea CBS 101466]ETN38122.1 hypothetical protein HMPREF1541_07746 [Cyphellophora europaea CBS 101466]